MLDYRLYARFPIYFLNISKCATESVKKLTRCTTVNHSTADQDLNKIYKIKKNPNKFNYSLFSILELNY